MKANLARNLEVYSIPTSPTINATCDCCGGSSGITLDEGSSNECMLRIVHRIRSSTQEGGTHTLQSPPTLNRTSSTARLLPGDKTTSAD